MRPLGALVRRGTEQRLRSASAATERNCFLGFIVCESFAAFASFALKVFEPFGGGTPPVHSENRNSHEQPLRSTSAATEQPG
jgi:hypothetical protein